MTTTTETDARARITAAVTAWPGVHAAGPGERGEYSSLLGRRELGHLHGSREDGGVPHLGRHAGQAAEVGRVTRRPCAADGAGQPAGRGVGARRQAAIGHGLQRGFPARGQARHPLLALGGGGRIAT